MTIPSHVDIYLKELHKLPYKKFLIPGISIGLLLIFFWQYIATGNSIRMGDFDYYSQLYEAFRITVLQYGQFPDWNPWLAGGTPLYANPQFGLISIQSVLVLIFGAVYGLKLAYVSYAVLGFLGMYMVGRNILKASQLRASLVALLWVMCGFFTSHNISHFTFALFFLLPWLFYLAYNRHSIRYSWLMFGGLLGLIGLSSIHYAFLMMTLIATIFAVMSIVRISSRRRPSALHLIIHKQDAVFVAKSVIVFSLLIAHRLYATMSYVSSNERLADSSETYPTVKLLLQSVFWPVDTMKLSIPEGIHSGWSWGEYSMYISMGAIIALFVSLVYGVLYYIRYRKITVRKSYFLILILIISALCFSIALGDFGKFSSFNILQHLPGFSQTRVPSRWMIFVVFGILCLILSIKRPRYIIDCLLMIGVIELFVFFGPIHNSGSDMFTPKSNTYGTVIRQYDNGKNHLDIKNDPMRSYFASTASNIGQVYADDSIINTLDGVYNTSRCGENKDKKCDLVISDNATVSYWSPNLIRIQRTSPGAIELNMNPYYGWYANDTLISPSQKRLDPHDRFMITDPSQSITLTYRAKGSSTQIIKKVLP